MSVVTAGVNLYSEWRQHYDGFTDAYARGSEVLEVANGFVGGEVFARSHWLSLNVEAEPVAQF